ncbi:MAG: TonB-dependent receptor [Bacteroidetes bacterium]|nr:TonB-dependent receptor [Bacteroidota bacterium]
MNSFRSLLAISLLFILNTAFAQEFKISGTLVNSTDQSPLVGAAVKLAGIRDSLKVTFTTSDNLGVFQFANLPRGPYRLTITYIGFEKVEKQVFAGGKSEDIGSIVVNPSSTNLNSVDINSTTVRAEQKGDTTQYNASAFKVTQDATTEDLIKKMPGITVENGTVKAHGEDVKKVLVDGKQFFGDDPSATLKNLPAEVVDKIQVFDKLSDQASWTGFDDGSGQKTLNIVTKRSRNNGQFGKFSAGYGTDDRYMLGANVNFFNGQRRITLLAMSNNVNQQNFSADDVIGSGSGSGGNQPGGGGRPSGGPGFQVGPSSGIFSTNAIGFNYTDAWGTKLNVNASYFWNQGNTTTNKITNRQYILNGASSQYYDELSNATSDNMNHRLNMRIEYNIDTNNSIILSPRLSIQDNTSKSILNDTTASGPEFIPSNILNLSTNNNDNRAQGYNFNNDLLFRHKFLKKGRTFSINLGTSLTERNKNNYVKTNSLYYATIASQVNDTIDVNQYGKTLANGVTLSSNLVYTEPVGKNSQVQVNYNISWSKNDNDKKTYNYQNVSDTGYTLFDTQLSNIYKNKYTTHRVGTGYLYQTEKVNLNAGITYQYAILAGNTSFPFDDSTHRTFNNILPNLMLNYKFSKVTNLRVVYRASTNAPSTGQLQKVIDNSNPLLLSTGNPDLKQEIRHFAMSRFSHSNAAKTANIFTMLFFQKTQNYIGNNTFIAGSDTAFLVNGDSAIMKRGAQLSVPKNLDGAWNARALLTVGFPIKPIKCNINFNTGISYNQIPSLINGKANESKTYGLNLGSVLSSNISEKLDFTLTYNVNYNLVENTIQPSLNSNYLFQIASAQFNWEFWKGFFIQNSVTYQNYQGISTKITTQYTLWTLNVGKKLFKNKAGEIKLSGYDILDQNKSLNRSVTDTYIEDSNTEVLKQYFMLTFTYNLRNFKGKMPQMEDRHFDGRPDGRWEGRPGGGPPMGMPPGPPQSM